MKHTCDELQGKILTLTCGLPRSGKTTWARSTGLPIVNPDSIRLALHGQRYAQAAEPFVWPIAFLMVEALFRAGHNHVIVDATNVTEARRKQWFDRFEGCIVALHVIDTKRDECIARARRENDEYIVPVIQRMAAEWDLSPEVNLP